MINPTTQTSTLKDRFMFYRVVACISSLELGLRWLNDRLAMSNLSPDEIRFKLVAQGGYRSGRNIVNHHD
jgi:hypothetical protein